VSVARSGDSAPGRGESRDSGGRTTSCALAHRAAFVGRLLDVRSVVGLPFALTFAAAATGLPLADGLPFAVTFALTFAATTTGLRLADGLPFAVTFAATFAATTTGLRFAAQLPITVAFAATRTGRLFAFDVGDGLAMGDKAATAGAKSLSCWVETTSTTKSRAGSLVVEITSCDWGRGEAATVFGGAANGSTGEWIRNPQNRAMSSAPMNPTAGTTTIAPATRSLRSRRPEGPTKTGCLSQ